MKLPLIIIVFMLSLVGLRAEAETGITLENYIRNVRQNKCWCVLIVPKIQKGGDIYDPSHAGSKLKGRGVVQLFEGFKELKGLYDVLLDPEIEQRIPIETDEERDQYSIYFLMEGAATSPSTVIDLDIYEDGVVRVFNRKTGSWILTEKFNIWFKRMVLPVR